MVIRLPFAFYDITHQSAPYPPRPKKNKKRVRHEWPSCFVFKLLVIANNSMLSLFFFVLDEDETMRMMAVTTQKRDNKLGNVSAGDEGGSQEGTRGSQGA